MNRIMLFLTIVSLAPFTSSCKSAPSKTTVSCENIFTLVSDFNKRFPEQGDYMEFILIGSYKTYYYPQENGCTCHYHLEFRTGEIIDDWGTYSSDGHTLLMEFPNAGVRAPVFTLYHSPTIDFFLVDELEFGGKTYNVVYQARYWASARG